MSHRNHKHTTPLPQSKHTTDEQGKLPSSQFGALVGTLDHWTLAANDGTKKDKNHVYLWLKAASGPDAGKYEAAVNVMSDHRLASGEPSSDLEIQYALRDEDVAQSDWPEQGFSGAEVSYSAMGLVQNEFTPVEETELLSLVESYATNCQLIAVYGTTYSEGTGIHDLHMNTPGKDGAVIFYFDGQNGGPVARWLFLKFENQTL